MKFKEYVSWCNDRSCDGCWGMIEAMACIDIINKVRKLPFWKREKEWQNNYAKQLYDEIIGPTNAKIAKFKQDV